MRLPVLKCGSQIAVFRSKNVFSEQLTVTPEDARKKLQPPQRHILNCRYCKINSLQVALQNFHENIALWLPEKRVIA